MKICDKCGSSFKNWQKIDGKYRCLKSRKYCLICSPFNKHNTKNLSSKVRVSPSGLLAKKCLWHLCNELTFTKFCSKKCSSKYWTNTRRQNYKMKIVELLGGKCSACGYNKSLKALHCHHVIPSEKLFNISSESYRRSWDLVLKEMTKCILLCANCHAEIH